MEARLTELEIKLGLAEDLLETLNTTVFRQQEQIDSLQRQLLELHRQMQSTQAGSARDPGEEVPPHY